MYFVPVTRDSRQLSRLFDDTFERFFGPAVAADAGAPAARSPALDVSETETRYTVRLDMPGVAKEDVKVSIEGRQVKVQASSVHEEKRTEGERVVHRERASAHYERSFTLPLEVNAAEAVAKLEQGVLTLTLPKRSERSAAQLTVN